MQPVTEMVQWAEELGIEGAGTRPWLWYGENTVLEKGGLHAGCSCRFTTLYSEPKSPTSGPNLPNGEIKMIRFAESDYMVGQCEGCKMIIWAMEVVQGGE